MRRAGCGRGGFGNWRNEANLGAMGWVINDLQYGFGGLGGGLGMPSPYKVGLLRSVSTLP